MGIRSIVTIAVRKDGKFLLVPKREGSERFWCFPSGEFKDRLNGNLSETVKRVLREFIAEDRLKGFEAEYLGSYLHKKGKNVRVGYNFIVDNFDFGLKVDNVRWVHKSEIKKIVRDSETLLLLKMNEGLL
jgi:hypothetical protein